MGDFVKVAKAGDIAPGEGAGSGSQGEEISVVQRRRNTPRDLTIPVPIGAVLSPREH